MNQLKRIQIEQKVDEIVKRAEEISKTQEELAEKTERLDTKDQQQTQELVRQQKDINNRLADLEKALAQLQEKMEEFPREMPLAEMEKGTGLMMMCSFGDQADIRFFREQNLTPVLAIDEDGRMNTHAGFLAGLSVEEARKRMIEELVDRKLLVGQKRITHRTPVCERSSHPIEFIAMKEFYLRQLEFRDEMKSSFRTLRIVKPQATRPESAELYFLGLDYLGPPLEASVDTPQ
jgi:hypothetical protein